MKDNHKSHQANNCHYGNYNKENFIFCKCALALKADNVRVGIGETILGK